MGAWVSRLCALSAGRSPFTERWKRRSPNSSATEDTILYTSCFDANGGLFETLLTEEDAILSDELNHASIIDGVRLCKARRLRFKNCDMGDLEAKLKMFRTRAFVLSQRMACSLWTAPSPTYRVSAILRISTTRWS